MPGNGHVRFGGRPSGKGPARSGTSPPGRPYPDREEVARRATPGRHRGGAATPAGPVLHLLQHDAAAPGAGPPHPRPGLCGPTQSRAHRPGHPRPLPVRTDRIDSGGSLTVRHNSRLHHIGLGARLAGTPVTMLIDNLHIRVIHRHTGQLIRELILDPTRDYQPRGLPPGPPKQTAATPRPASRSRPNPPPTAEVRAGRRPPAGPRP
jgi:hypothetical protein